MRWIYYLTLLITFSFFGCGIREREAALQKREAQLAQREQEVLLKEESLQQREQELLSKVQRLDSTAQDTAAAYNPNMLGKWNVRMTCTEATCPGSAVGDTKYENWELSYQNNQIVARAMADDKLVRVYTGNYKNNTLELTEDVERSPASPDTKMLLRLTLLNENTMEGQREIVRADCRIIYALQLEKQVTAQ